MPSYAPNGVPGDERRLLPPRSVRFRTYTRPGPLEASSRCTSCPSARRFCRRSLPLRAERGAKGIERIVVEVGPLSGVDGAISAPLTPDSGPTSTTMRSIPFAPRSLAMAVTCDRSAWQMDNSCTDSDATTGPGRVYVRNRTDRGGRGSSSSPGTQLGASRWASGLARKKSAGEPAETVVPEVPLPLVLGFGNVLLSDDGAGVQILEHAALSACGPDAAHFIDAGTLSFSSLPYIEAADAMLVLDAADIDETPGAIALFEGRRWTHSAEHPPAHRSRGGTHRPIGHGAAARCLPHRAARFCVWAGDRLERRLSDGRGGRGSQAVREASDFSALANRWIVSLRSRSAWKLRHPPSHRYSAANWVAAPCAALLSELAVPRPPGREPCTWAIDLRSLPMSPANRAELERALGEGEVRAASRPRRFDGPGDAYGRGVVGRASRRRGGLQAEELKVAQVPAILAAQPMRSHRRRGRCVST